MSPYQGYNQDMINKAVCSLLLVILLGSASPSWFEPDVDQETVSDSSSSDNSSVEDFGISENYIIEQLDEYSLEAMDRLVDTDPILSWIEPSVSSCNIL